METGLAGKTAIVTGAASGTGLACARALAAEGTRLVLGDVDEDGIREAAWEVGAVGLTVDVADPGDVERLVNEVAARFGRLDVLVTTATAFDSSRFDELTVEEWDRVQAVNLRGVFLCARAALRLMRPQRSGRIVTLGTFAGQPADPAAGGAYAASSAGVHALTRWIARFAGPYGIAVSCVGSGAMGLPVTRAWAGRPEEVAALVVMLASDAAGLVHGAQVDVGEG
jgi:NAD(P)-dependent dehydrogenase (short-subunit alcohol dehydrogenase family)